MVSLPPTQWQTARFLSHFYQRSRDRSLRRRAVVFGKANDDVLWAFITHGIMVEIISPQKNPLTLVVGIALVNIGTLGPVGVSLVSVT